MEIALVIGQFKSNNLLWYDLLWWGTKFIDLEDRQSLEKDLKESWMHGMIYLCNDYANLKASWWIKPEEKILWNLT